MGSAQCLPRDSRAVVISHLQKAHVKCSATASLSTFSVETHSLG